MTEEKKRGRPPKADPNPRPMKQAEHDAFMVHYRAFQVAANRRNLDLMKDERDKMGNILNEVMGL